ncbi:hypothetical protein R3Q08_26535 [Rhodococcus erythropolis]|uniref:hypothetical protein n=1 Tax=Rhodococcus erythropolis TaxID=1833 RepID=UPI00294A58FA|nr:hypothetical protein [Rhodococcus erythropolis]MDV6211828.1 hypothetical protein [Rhodococcus erythropolis]
MVGGHPRPSRPAARLRAAKLGGQITLDGIRAAQRFDALGLSASPVGMAGYSGAPMNSDKMAKALGQQKHPAFRLAMAATLGLEREYPDRMPITSQLNSAGQQLRDQIANACTNAIIFLRRRPIPRRCRGS